LSALRRQGLSALVSCSEACRIEATLLTTSGDSRPLTAPVQRQLPGAGQTRVTARPSPQARGTVRPRMRLRLRLTATDAAGNTTTVVKTIVVKR
jgi:hypothetical protein